MSHKIHEGYADTRVCHQLTHGWIKHYFQTVGFCIDVHAGPSWLPLCWLGLCNPLHKPRHNRLCWVRGLYSNGTENWDVHALASTFPLSWPVDSRGVSGLKRGPIDRVSGSIPRDFSPLPVVACLHRAAAEQTRSCPVSCGAYGRPSDLASEPRPDRLWSARR